MFEEFGIDGACHDGVAKHANGLLLAAFDCSNLGSKENRFAPVRTLGKQIPDQSFRFNQLRIIGLDFVVSLREFGDNRIGIEVVCESARVSLSL